MKSLRYFFLFLAITLFGGSIYAQKDMEKMMRERGEYYFSLDVQQPNQIQVINELCSVDATNGETVVCYANQKQFDALLKQGYKPQLMTPPSMKNEIKMWDGKGSYDWDTYPTYDQYEDMMQQFAEDHPDRCTYIELGTLASGRKLMVCRLNNGETEGKPHFLYTSTMHGDEVTGMMLMLRLIDYLLTSDDPQVQLVMENLDIFICPNTNPDGTYHGGNGNVYGATRYNGNGIDLNRHYPDFDKGPHPDGENHYQNETAWLMQLAEDYRFTMSANYHGGAEVMNYPWDTYQPLHPDDAWWQLVCHEYANLTHQQSSSYMTDYNNGITNGYAWYTISGSRQDWMNYYAECREVTIECSNSKTPNANQMPSFWNYNRASMLTYMEEALYGIHGTVTDSITGEPLTGVTVTIEGHDHHGSSVTTHEAGDYHRPIKAGTYTVTYTLSGYYPKSYTLTVADGETLVQDVQLRAGEGIIPDFTASTTQVALGGSVNFTDQTWGAHLASWEWQFEGGSPSTSTAQNPTVTYNGTGTFDVTLTVTNEEGQSETITKHNYITVAESYNMQNGTITTCNALFYDDGGQNSNYGDRKDYTLTFMPSGEGRKISVNFLEFNTENSYDYLYIYDGTSTSATQIGIYDGSDNPGEVTATNAEGALTFRFTSDMSVNATGWVATVHCIYDAPLIISVNADPEVVNEGETSQLTATCMGGAGGYTYSWEPAETLDDATSCCPIATPVDTETTYRVVVTDADGNTAEGQVTVSIRDWAVDENSIEARVYPNPASNILIIESHDKMDYVLFNSLGQEMLKGSFEKTTQIGLSDLSKGMYFLRLSNGTASKVQKVFVK